MRLHKLESNGLATTNAAAQPHQNSQEGSQRPNAPLASDFLFATSDWVYSVAIVIFAFHLGAGLAAAAAALLIHAAARLLVIAVPIVLPQSKRRLALIEALRAGLILALVFVASADALWIVLVAASSIGFIGASIDQARGQLVPARPVVGDSQTVRARLICRWDQLAMITGSLVAGALIVAWSELPAFAVAAGLALVAAGILLRLPEEGLRASLTTAPAAPRRTFARSGVPQALLVALAAGAALGIALRVMLVEIVLDEHGHTELVYGLFIALAGAGAFAGPLSIPRLLSRLPAALVLGCVTAALSVALVTAHLADPLALVIPVILACGVLAVTGERAGETILRRTVPASELDANLQLLAAVTVAGQIVALATIASLDHISGSLAAVIALTTMSIVCALIPILMYVRERNRPRANNGG